MTFDERMALLDQKVLDDIAEYGWSDMHIFPTKEGDGLPFNYTVGFTVREHPEILIMGLDSKTMHGILATVYEQVKSGTKFEPDRYYNFVLTTHRVAFVEISDPLDNRYPMTLTEHLMGEFTALQLIWPDAFDRFPWHEDFDPEFRDHQVLLGPWRGEDSADSTA